MDAIAFRLEPIVASIEATNVTVASLKESGLRGWSGAVAGTVPPEGEQPNHPLGPGSGIHRVVRWQVFCHMLPLFDASLEVVWV